MDIYDMSQTEWVDREDDYFNITTWVGEGGIFVTTSLTREGQGEEEDGTSWVNFPGASTFGWCPRPETLVGEDGYESDKEQFFSVDYGGNTRRLTEGGLSEAHGYIVDQIRRGEQPGWGGG